MFFLHQLSIQREPALMLDFVSNLLASMIGAFLGFLFSAILVWIAYQAEIEGKKKDDNRRESRIIVSLLNYTKPNIVLIKTIREELADNHDIHYYFEVETLKTLISLFVEGSIKVQLVGDLFRLIFQLNTLNAFIDKYNENKGHYKTSLFGYLDVAMSIFELIDKQCDESLKRLKDYLEVEITRDI